MPTKLRLLLAEDDPDDAELLARELGRGGYDVALHRVDTEPAFCEALDAGGWDLIVSDFLMPRFSGRDAVRIYREYDIDVPFIIVSGTVGEDAAVEAMRNGVRDYIIKGNISRLCSAVDRELRAAESRREARATASALEVEERRYQSIYDSASVALWEVDLSALPAWLSSHGVSDAAELSRKLEQRPELLEQSAREARVLDVNETTITLLGASSASDLVGSFDRILRLGLRDAWRRILEAIAAHEDRVEIETTATALDGREVHILLSARLPRDASALRNVVITVCDTTELWQLQSQMHAAQRMESMGRLAGGIAHDFNNLLCVIQSYAGFLRDRFEAGDGALDDITAIEDATARAARLTSQLLGFGRRQVQQAVVLDLNTPVRELAQMLPRVIGDNVRIGTALAADLGLVKADATQIEQVLMNLTVNARDAMPEGGLITIETANVELESVYVGTMPDDVPAGSYVMLAVTDTGTGMDEEIRTKVFEPFFTTKPQGKGTGLGLATTFGIVRQSVGHISLYSELGVGTTFKVYLPRVDAAQPTAIEHERAVERAGGTETILLVENEDRIRTAAQRILESHGYTVLSSPSGTAALEIVEQHGAPVHVLLTDVVMPEMSGQRLAERLRAVTPAVKSVFMSGYAGNAIVQHGVLDATAVFLPKPFSSSMLLEAVRRGLDQPD